MADKSINIKIQPPNAKQKLFFLADKPFVAYGGARGGGKTWGARRKAELLCAEYPGIKILIVRRTYKELYSNHTMYLISELKGVATYRDSEKCFKFINGSRIFLGYCDNERDVDQYQGLEYDVIFIDEATQLTEYQFATFKACLRGVNDFPKRMYLTCNPGGVGHSWVKRLFVDREFKTGENPDDYCFVQAKATDNSAMMKSNPNYMSFLDSLPDGLREAWRDGDWDVYSGQFFTEFDRQVHTIEPFEIPSHWRRYVTMDYGLDMLACYWIAVDEHGYSYVYRELYQKNLIISDAACEIMKRSKDECIYEYLAPPDLWARQRESGTTTAELFGQFGIFLTKTSNNRVDGWRAMKEHFKVFTAEDGETKTSKLRIFKNCYNLIRCIPELQYNDKNPEDCATEPHEITHAPDALRCFSGVLLSEEKGGNHLFFLE